MILRGELRQGDALPSVRAVRAEWDVSQSVAQQAIAHLHLAERLVRTDPSGTYVGPPRAAISPQQRMRLDIAPSSEAVTVTAASLVDAPEYIRPMFGLSGTSNVLRREEVTALADGTPHMLAVTWCHPVSLSAVPELMALQPLPDPKGAAHLIAERAGYDPGDLTGGVAFECRAAKEDGRERPALDLEQGAYVLAGVSGWRHGDDLLAYTEFILPPNQVVEADIEP
jgi:DNA-binding GntR family transcriptional regulator